MNAKNDKLEVTRKTKQLKASFCVVALVLTLFVSTQLTAPVFAQSAGTIINGKVVTQAYINVAPSTVGTGQYVVVTGWVNPQPPNASAFYQDYVINLVNPNGENITKTLDSETAATFWFTYTPTIVGTWKAQLSWSGDETHIGSQSPVFEFTVQQQPIPTDQYAAPLPDSDYYWQRPISAQNREWSLIGGSWYNAGGRFMCDAANDAYNPYSTAPRSAHISWILQQKIGGLIGAQYDQSTAYGGPSSFIIMAGRFYYISTDGLHCLDERTGQELWIVPGATGSVYGQIGPNPYVWCTSSSSWVKYDASTGAKVLTVTGLPTFPSVSGFARLGISADGYFYGTQYMSGNLAAQQFRDIFKWDASSTSTKWVDHVVWESVSDEAYVFPNYTGPVTFADAANPNSGGSDTKNLPIGNIYVWNGVICMEPNGGNWTACWNETNGELIWSKEQPFWMEGLGGVVDGVFWVPSYDLCLYGMDAYTGASLWKSDPTQAPFGIYWAYNSGVAYGNIYALNYDGHVYCFDGATGKMEWSYYSGDAGYETAYGEWPFYGNPAIADGVVFASTQEHSPTSPLWRGGQLVCLDAITGQPIWKILEYGGEQAIADGALFSADYYTGQTYCFFKGQTATTITASPEVGTVGSGFLIQGTVTDQSPAQPGTPAISDESMSAWMEYLHMQQPKPTDATGVSVILTALDANGNAQQIGTVKTDANGHYSTAWNPTSSGVYTIVATFSGSESYFSSNAETSIYVSQGSGSGPTPAVSPTPINEPTGSAAITSTYVAIGAVVIIGVVVAAALILRRRKGQ
jgi:outer membrane protein assembly factor BamB